MNIVASEPVCFSAFVCKIIQLNLFFSAFPFTINISARTLLIQPKILGKLCIIFVCIRFHVRFALCLCGRVCFFKQVNFVENLSIYRNVQCICSNITTRTQIGKLLMNKLDPSQPKSILLY